MMLENGAESGQASRPSKVWKPIAGPIDRVSFFEEQRRNRRAARRLSVWCGLVVGIMLLATILVSVPLIFVYSNLALLFLHHFFALPDWVLLPNRLMESTPSGASTLTPAMHRIAVLMAAVIVAIPILIFLFGLWMPMRAIFARTGVGSVLLRLGARPARPEDMEERQLVNIVEEMAIAAGIPAPRVMLLDSDVVNAGAVGTAQEKATVVISRRLLDEMDRDETQGVLAYLIGAIGNGDLATAQHILLIFQTFGLIITMLNALFGGQAPKTLLLLLLYPLQRGDRDGAAADRLSELVLSNFQPENFRTGFETIDRLSARLKAFQSRQGLVGSCMLSLGSCLIYPFVMIPLSLLLVALLPLLLGRVLLWFALMMVNLFLLGPLIASLWRARSHLADATAVQLTRNPDGLANALVSLWETGGLVPGSRWAELMFIVGPEVTGRRLDTRHLQEIQALMQQHRNEPVAQRVAALKEAAETMRSQDSGEQSEKKQATFADALNIVGTFHPSINSRIQRLVALGATHVPWQVRREYPWGCYLLGCFGFLVLSGLILGGLLHLVAAHLHH